MDVPLHLCLLSMCVMNVCLYYNSVGMLYTELRVCSCYGKHYGTYHTHQLYLPMHTWCLCCRKGGGISETGNFAVSKKSQYQLKLKVTVHEISDWSLPDNKPIFVVFEVGGGVGVGRGRDPLEYHAYTCYFKA